MAKLTGTREYTTVQMTKIRAAFSFLNNGTDNEGSPATAAQLNAWIDRQVEAKVLQYYQRVEGAKADAVAATAVENL
jgi:hypothetical protein